MIILQEKIYLSSGLCGNTPKLRDFCKVTRSQECGKVEAWGYGELCEYLRKTPKLTNPKMHLPFLSGSGAVWVIFFGSNSSVS